jgi:hypothetical protein
MGERSFELGLLITDLQKLQTLLKEREKENDSLKKSSEDAQAESDKTKTALSEKTKELFALRACSEGIHSVSCLPIG